MSDEPKAPKLIKDFFAEANADAMKEIARKLEQHGRYKAALERIMLHGWENTGHPMTAHCRGCGGWAKKGSAHYQAIEHWPDCIVDMAVNALTFVSDSKNVR